MTTSFRFADFTRLSRPAATEIRLGDLTPAVVRGADGGLIAPTPTVVQLEYAEVVRLLQPYVSRRFMDQVAAVVPLAGYLALFQMIFLRQGVENALLVTAGLLAVIVGLMLFLEGLKVGFMPFGTIIGGQLPRRSPLPLVLLITMLLGIGVTFAEPAIGALKIAGRIVSAERAPYLYAMLNQYTSALVVVVGASVGLAAVAGTVRLIYGWSLKPFIYVSLVAVLVPTLLAAADPELAKTIGLAWDAGAVTTGPVTVPLVLSLGIGIASAAGKGESGLSGFGIVTLASLFPVVGVTLLAFYVAAFESPAAIVETARQMSDAAGSAAPAWFQRSPFSDVLAGIRAIVPLVIFLLVVLRLVLRERLPRASEISLGIALTLLGMCLFNVGLTYGLSLLGSSAGGLVPAAFMELSDVAGSPLYRYGVGLFLAIAFAWVLGYGATVAEPALNALGVTAEALTNGVFKKRALILAVSIGVATGVAVGIAKLIFDLPLIWLLLGSYAVAAVLTVLSDETFVNVAWDSAGVTTGPVTVPLVLAMGLGFGNASQAVEGFGILCMASVGPIISVLLFGLWARYQVFAEARAAEAAASAAPETSFIEQVQAIV